MNDAVFDPLKDAYDRQALGHALLFVVPAPEDEAVRDRLEAFRALLLCGDRQSGQPACGHCASCRLLTMARAAAEPHQLPHPDAIEMTPTESNAFKVDEIRLLAERFSLRTSLSPNRVAWIREADALAGSGAGAPANALLKILEEPRPHTFLILETARPDALLPTIRSRCQTFRLRRLGARTAQAVPSEWESLLAWLRAGAPVGKGPRTPADGEDFWKNRDEAVAHSIEAREALWNALRPGWAAMRLDEARRVHDLFALWEEALLAIRAYANPALQWLNFRTHARLDA